MSVTAMNVSAVPVCGINVPACFVLEPQKQASKQASLYIK